MYLISGNKKFVQQKEGIRLFCAEHFHKGVGVAHKITLPKTQP